MKRLSLTSALLLCSLAAAAQSSTKTATTDQNGSPNENVGARAEFCRKGCMAHHDSSVLACRLVKKPEETAACINSANDKRTSCELECARRHPVKEAAPAQGRPSPKR
jgi:hypothetical protein